ncbi:UNVERIFIED_CONTAM: hypothetical protein K2H54_075475 [Gekko kuhli]
MANYIHVPPGSPEVPKLDIVVSERDPSGGGGGGGGGGGAGYRQGALRLLSRLRPDWKPEDVTLKKSASEQTLVADFTQWNRMNELLSRCGP